MTFFLTFHDPLHNVPRSISPASLSTLFWDFLDTRFFSRPVTPAFMYPLFTPNYTCFSHLLFAPALYTYEAPRDLGNGGGSRDFRLSQKSEPPANSDYLPAAARTSAH
ncbi:MAG: hypothetical protein VXA34_07325, partial [Gammaproteobacteria bacterium]